MLAGPGSRNSSSGGGGSLIDDASFIINGTGFGTNAATATVFTGGLTGPIESQANQTAVKTVGSSGSGILGSGWAANTGYSDTQQFVSTIQAYNHTKSIYSRYGYTTYSGGVYDTGNFQYGIAYDFGSNFRAGYFNFMYFLNPNGGTSGQIKFFRSTGATNGGYQDSDDPNILMNQFSFASIVRHWLGADQGNVSVSGTIWEFNQWVRYEIMFLPGTGTTDGSIQHRITRVSDGTVLSSGTATSRQFFGSPETGFHWLVLQGYIQLGIANDGSQVFIDQDIYGSVNQSSATAPKFLYIGDNATFSSCTRLAIQNPNAWSNTQISGPKFNKGGFSSGTTVYWHVMDGINTPNQAGILAGVIA